MFLTYPTDGAFDRLAESFERRSEIILPGEERVIILPGEERIIMKRVYGRPARRARGVNAQPLRDAFPVKAMLAFFQNGRLARG